jgi:hypothetical protein
MEKSRMCAICKAPWDKILVRPHFSINCSSIILDKNYYYFSITLEQFEITYNNNWEFHENHRSEIFTY